MPSLGRLLPHLVVASSSMLSLSSTAHAQPKRNYSLRFEAPRACPNSEQLVRQIQQRSQVAHRVRGPARFRLDVRVNRTGDETRGTLVIAEGDARTRRVVQDESCARVISAVALMAAVAMDPNAETGPLAPLPRATRAKPPRRSPSRARPKRARVRRWRGEAGFMAGATGGVAPSVAPFYGPWLGWEPSATGSWRPELRLAALVGRATAATNAGHASFTWTAARAALCIPHLALGEQLDAAPCLLADAGRVHGAGYATDHPQTQNATWLALGLQAMVSWTLDDTLIVSAQAGAVSPLIRDRFLFLPSTPVHRLPGLAGFGSLSLGLAW